MFPKRMPIYWRTFVVGQVTGFLGGVLLWRGLVGGEWNLVLGSVLMMCGGVFSARGYQEWIAVAGPGELPVERDGGL